MATVQATVEVEMERPVARQITLCGPLGSCDDGLARGWREA